VGAWVGGGMEEEAAKADRVGVMRRTLVREGSG
jgi:hypothetical protein